MTLLRDALLEFLVCLHVIGAAVLFRRLFPRDSPWLAFFVPTLGVMFVLNFVEHFVALPSLGWLLPITLGGLLLVMLRAGALWDGLRFPSALFVFAFTFILLIKGLHPEIACWTEGLSDLARMLDFCLGDKVPPTDSWLPPYDHGGYYTFQHYGASILKRLFNLDIGTGYNLSLTLLNALTCMAAAAVAFSLTGKKWIAAAILFVVLANFTGGGIFMIFFGSHGFDMLLAYDLHHGWADAHHNPFWKLLASDPYEQRTRLYTPGNDIYMPEFHANLGGTFLTLASLFAGVEVLKEERSNWPWILLIVLPVTVIITETWFLPVVLFFCAGSVAIALATSRRPRNWRWVALTSGIAIVLIWPSVARLTDGSYPVGFRWTLKEEHTFPWLFIEQWWPVYIPWLALCFIWHKLSPPARWLHAGVPILLIFFEFFTIGDREPLLEKIWSDLYGIGLVAFLSLVYVQRAWPYRVLTVIMVGVTFASLHAWWIESTKGVDWGQSAFRLQGDQAYYDDTQKRRMIQAMQRLHGATVLSGRPGWAYTQGPGVATFSENRSYIGWSYPEVLAGNAEEPYYRDQLSDQFYEGRMADPLGFLASNNIEAVLIWPEEKITDAILAQLKIQLAPNYYYVDCKMDEPDNAGIFFRFPETLNSAGLSEESAKVN